MPLEIMATVIESIAPKLSGAAGTTGVDSVDLQNWLLRFGSESQGLREVVAALGSWLANGQPPWAACRAIMACRLVALDKKPGVRPVGIGESLRRLLAKSVVKIAGAQAMQAAGNLNLCAGLPAGIEGAVHSIL